MAPGEMSSNDDGGEEREAFQEIWWSHDLAACHALQRRHFFFPVTRRPAVPVLVADEM